jgi:Taurine catabolism dioxygenase TauD, TfdA family
MDNPSHPRQMPSDLTCSHKAPACTFVFPAKMVNSGPYKRIECFPLHTTFGAEVRGVDWSKPVPKEVNDAIADAAHHYGILLFKTTGLDNESHVAWAKNFGELDSTLQFHKPGAKTRLAPYYDLWDAGNLDADGNVIPGDTRQYEYNKVLLDAKSTHFREIHFGTSTTRRNILAIPILHYWLMRSPRKVEQHKYLVSLCTLIISSPMSELRTRISRRRGKMRSRIWSFIILYGTQGNWLHQAMKPLNTRRQFVQGPSIDLSKRTS